MHSYLEVIKRNDFMTYTDSKEQCLQRSGFYLQKQGKGNFQTNIDDCDNEEGSEESLDEDVLDEGMSDRDNVNNLSN
jgi:hypothetical protein